MSRFILRMSIDAPTHLPLSRREVADQIEALIAILDRFEVDPDLEDDGSAEPYLGWFEGRSINDQSNDDREADAGDEGEMDDDREWSLGSLNHAVDQRRWSMGAPEDRELTNEDGTNEDGNEVHV